MTTTHSFPNLGTQQSPITLESTLVAKDLGVTICWDSLDLEPKKDGYCPTRKLGASSASGDYLLLDGQSYVPVDCHWHFPAEHELGGQKKRFAAEVHVVHVHVDDVRYALQGKLDWCRIAVLGVFVEVGKSAYVPMQVAAGGAKRTATRNQILPRSNSAIRYDGSLTTPPYSENVTFIVFENPVTATRAQLKSKGLENARALQAVNRRYCVCGRVGTRKASAKKASAKKASAKKASAKKASAKKASTKKSSS